MKNGFILNIRLPHGYWHAIYMVYKILFCHEGFALPIFGANPHLSKNLTKVGIFIQVKIRQLTMK